MPSRRIALLAAFAIFGCTTPPPSPSPPPSPPTASSPPRAPSIASAHVSAPCTITMIDIRVRDISSENGGAYEALGTIDLTTPVPNEPFSLNERINVRACRLGGEAVGVLATESGTGTEYVVLRKRKASSNNNSTNNSNRPSIDYFPAGSGSGRPADIR